MKFLIVTSMLIIFQYMVYGYDDIPRHFTNGHGGYQFFHAAETQNSNRRMDSDNDLSFTNPVKYLVEAPKPESDALKTDLLTKPEVTVQVPSKRHKLVSKTKVVNNLSDQSDTAKSDASSQENQILKETPIGSSPRPRFRFTTPSSTIRRHQVTRKRIVVRKFKPQSEKNKKREISASNGNSLHAERKIPHKYKFTNRNFKPQQPAVNKKNNAQSLNINRSSLYSRKPSDTFKQLHFRKLELTTTTTTPSTMQSMKEKRHLANMRFFNRRKIRS